MGYEVDARTLDAYSQNFLNLVDSREERFGTYKEKTMELHAKFNEPERKRKVTEIVEEILMEEGHPRERVRAVRAMRDAEEKEKKQKTTLISSHAKPRVTRSSPALVKTSPTQNKPSSSSAKGKGVLR